MTVIDSLKFDAQGLIPVITQDAETGEVLMFAWMNREAVQRTLETGKATYWSRSRGKFWVKGESSGHTQQVQGLYVDCDQDVLLMKVTQMGAACHDGYRSCFYREIPQGNGPLKTIAERLVDPAEVYKS